NLNTRRIPVVMITAARTDSESRIKALEYGADAFVSKPIDEIELKAQIMAMLHIKESEDNKLTERERLEKLVAERTSLLEKELEERKKAELRLQQAVSDLELSKQAALNLMEDLQTEIIEKQHTQETLKSSEEQFRLVFENTPVGLLKFDAQGVIEACNDQFVSIIGSSRAALIGLDMNLLPDKKVVRAIQNALKGEKVFYSGTYFSYTADKKTEVKIQFAPIFSNNKLVGGVGIVEDITEMVNAELKRRESEEKFSKSFYSSPAAISITRKENGEYVDVNDAYCRLSGFSREQLIGRTVTGLGIVDVEVRNALLEEFKKRGSLQQAEVPLSMRNHEERIILISFEQFDLSGETFLLSTLLDITERKQYEAELFKLTRAVEQSPVSIVITDLDGKIEYINPKVAEITGYYPHELIGQNPRLFSSGEKGPEEYKAMYETIQTGETWQGEFHNRKKSGELYWESATISPVVNDSGIMTHYIAVKEDVTDKKRMELELLESENLYRNVFMGNPVPMWVYDVETLRFIEVNEAAVRDYGYSREEFMHMSIADIRPAEDVPALMQDVAENKNRSQGPEQWRHMTKDGSILQVEIISHAVPAKSGISHRMVMAYNVTEKTAAQEALQKAKSMAEASDRLKTAFLNNISHEVRTPLNGILGATSLLNDPDISRDETGEMLEIINESTERLINTITDYMDISLITSKNLDVHSKEIVLSKLFANLVSQFRNTAKRKELEWKAVIPENLNNLSLVTDEELLTKVLKHLIGNAFKYTNKGFVELGITSQSDKIILHVKDSGIGIEKEAVKQIFNPFTQEDMSTSRRYEGSGLGLSIVQGICELLGANVSVATEKGKGSVFSIEFPQKGVQTIASTEIPAGTTPNEKNTILIAEDDESNFVVLDLLLRQMTTARILRAVNGKTAVEQCFSNPDIGLVLMDLKMPVMDGLEATRLIKAQLPDLKIVAITAYAMSGDEHKALSAGCDDYIAKPVALKTLKAKIQTYGVAMKPQKI
ncbi:MAG: PAS domain S-box protein, partial [Bacteroidales bacterium]|nr:PAS domain S-box protein [Bacteroidales bacterium]